MSEVNVIFNKVEPITFVKIVTRDINLFKGSVQREFWWVKILGYCSDVESLGLLLSYF